MKKRILEWLAATCFSALLIFAAVLAVGEITGCKAPTAQKQTVNTLFTIHKSVDLVLDDYLDLVVKGAVSTNGVPRVLQAYTTFQAAYNTALPLVIANTNATPPQTVTDAATSFFSVAQSAKKGVTP